MNADLTLTAYDKRTDYLCRVHVLPESLRGFARTVAGVAPTDPHIAGVYPLTPDQAVDIARQADVLLDLTDYDYCLETIARAEPPRSHAAS